MKKSSHGFSAPLVIIVLAIAAVFAGYYFFYPKAPEAHKASNPNVASHESSEIQFSQILNAYVPDFLDDGNFVTLTNGRYEGTFAEGKDASGPNTSFSLDLSTGTSTYAYGDMNGDGISDIAAIIGEYAGGTGYFGNLAVFINHNGAPEYKVSETLGDRIKINKVSIANGIVSVDMITQGPGEGMCCGTLQKTVSYKLSGDTLVSLDTPTQ